MSVNQTQVAVNSGASLFVSQGNVSTPTTANPYVSIGQLTTDQINIDGVRVDGSTAGGGQLLVNGVAVATINQNVSSIANWAQYPALSSITYASGGGTGGLINMRTGQISSLNVSSLVVTGGASIPNATNVSTTTAYIGGLTVSSINTFAPVVSVVNDLKTYSGTTKSYTTPTGSSPISLVSSSSAYTFTLGRTYQVTAPYQCRNSNASGTATYVGLNILPQDVAGGIGNLDAVINYFPGAQDNSIGGQITNTFQRVIATATVPLVLRANVQGANDAVTSGTVTGTLGLGVNEVISILDLGVPPAV